MILIRDQFDQRAEALNSILSCCTLCPRKCRVNRLEGEIGYCRAGKDLKISSFNPHFGEEEPLVGSMSQGSGAVFLTHCNLLCVFCQNYDISHQGKGEIFSEKSAASVMLYLQKMGCCNINFVTPTHYAPQLIRALKIAVNEGLNLPIVWNCSGYEDPDIIKMLRGIVDIYMPDFKFGNDESAKEYCNAHDYFNRCTASIKEMYDQVGDLELDKDGIAKKGLLIRHLVMPNDTAGSKKVLRFLAEEISQDTYVNIMAQYRPAGKAHNFKKIARYPTSQEFQEVIRIAGDLGLYRGF